MWGVSGFSIEGRGLGPHIGLETSKIVGRLHHIEFCVFGPETQKHAPKLSACAVHHPSPVTSVFNKIVGASGPRALKQRSSEMPHDSHPLLPPTPNSMRKTLNLKSRH